MTLCVKLLRVQSLIELELRIDLFFERLWHLSQSQISRDKRKN